MNIGPLLTEQDVIRAMRTIHRVPNFGAYDHRQCDGCGREIFAPIAVIDRAERCPFQGCNQRWNGAPIPVLDFLPSSAALSCRSACEAPTWADAVEIVKSPKVAALARNVTRHAKPLPGQMPLPILNYESIRPMPRKEW